jgi:hypothetical protein
MVYSRVCSKCGLLKPIEEFHFRGKNGDRRTDCKVCMETARRRRRKLHPESCRGLYERQGRSSMLKAKFGLTVADYEEMLAGQNGACKICGKTTRKRLAVDHDHETGEVRGLLCHRCNMGLGLFDDNPLLLLRASRHVAEKRDA